jgi:aryl-alcohol dehydrogenase-like predicted oxidoreductase
VSSGERLIQQASLGITFFETGDAYGQGANEAGRARARPTP